MEIKAILNKPFSEEKRIDFIVEQNHKLGFEIKETSKGLEAWGLSQEEIKQKEIERVGNLSCTKRVFVLMLQKLGIDYYKQLKPLIESNPQAQLEWDLCVELSRNNPMLDIMGEKLKITSDKLDKLFKYANSEITLEEFNRA